MCVSRVHAVSKNGAVKVRTLSGETKAKLRETGCKEAKTSKLLSWHELWSLFQAMS